MRVARKFSVVVWSTRWAAGAIAVVVVGIAVVATTSAGGGRHAGCASGDEEREGGGILTVVGRPWLVVANDRDELTCPLSQLD